MPALSDAHPLARLCRWEVEPMPSLVESIGLFAEMVQGQLRGSFCEPWDFASLAVTGEELRLMCRIRESDHGARALEDYDVALTSGEFRALVPFHHELTERLEYAINELACASDDSNEQDDAIARLNGVLHVAAAGRRTGALSERCVWALGQRAQVAAAEIAPRKPRLRAALLARCRCLGSDPKFPHLYDWMHDLAEIAGLRG